MSKIPEITVIVPTYNREEVLINTIKDVLEGQTQKDLELIVVDQSLKHNESTQKFLDDIKDPRFKYFKTSPPSVTAAKNFALNKTRSTYAVILDDDVILDKNLLKVYLQTFKDMPHVSAIGGRVLQKDFPIQKEVLKFDEHMISHGVFTATESSYTNAFPGGNCALRVKEVLAIGGFDTRYRDNAFREESDMSMRIANLGYKIFYQPKAIITHLAAPYGGNRVKTHIYDNPAFYKNELLFTLRFTKGEVRKQAIQKKFEEYCEIIDEEKAKIRKDYFKKGLFFAYLRLYFGRQFVAKEIK